MKSHHIKFQKILAVLLAILALVGGLFGLCRAVASARAYDIAPLTDERLAEPAKFIFSLNRLFILCVNLARILYWS